MASDCGAIVAVHVVADNTRTNPTYQMFGLHKALTLRNGIVVNLQRLCDLHNLVLVAL